MIVFPVLIPGQNFLFSGTGREGKFEACIPENSITRYYGNCLNTHPPTHTPGVGCWVSLELSPITSAPEGFPNQSSLEMFSQKIILTHHGRAKYSLELSSTPYDLNLKAFSPCQSNHDSRCT